MRKISRFAVAIIKNGLTTIFSLGAIGVVLAFFWTQIRPWFADVGFAGVDTPHYIHFVTYYLKNPHWPMTAWDYFWHNGVPRVVDLAWLHYTIAAALTRFYDLYDVLKIYPAVSLAIGAVFVYLLFYDLCKSIIIATSLAIGFVLSQGYYISLISAGVVLSTISQMFLPAQLYFLVRFAKGGSGRNLILGAIFSALGLYSHGLMMMFFGLIPACLFLVFADRRGEKLITGQTILQTLVFGIATLTISAFGVWPNLALARAGGSTTTFIQHWTGRDPTNLQNLFKLTNVGVVYGFIAGAVVFLLFWLIGKRKIPRPVIPLVVLNLWILAWMFTYTYTGNPLYEVLFPGRLFWIWPLLLGALAAALLSPLSVNVQASKLIFRIGKIFSFGIIKLAITGFISLGILGVFRDIETFKTAIQPLQEWTRISIEDSSAKRNAQILELVDKNKPNVRFWTHDNNINLSWIPISNMPLSEGYGHVWTYYSRLWEGWFYGVMSDPNWQSDEIPREMAKPQSLFFLDWYGVKYMAAVKGSGEWDVAGHFYGDNLPYLAQKRVFPDGRSVFEVSDEYTSPLVAATNVPVIGFVGDPENYMTFVKDLAMLNLNTSYLIPVKLAETVGGISTGELSLVDMLVVYGEKRDRLGSGRGWAKIYDYVRKGGKLWVETGGESLEKGLDSLPNVFPMVRNTYAPLGTDWEPGGDWATKIDFSNLSKLDFRGTPWKLSYADPKAVKKGSQILLTQKGYPVVVTQNIEKGKVLWTGVNFWYRPEEFRQNGMEEIVPVEMSLETLWGSFEKKRVDFEVKRDQPEEISVSGSNFSGVVFKENHWPGWIATVENGGKKKTVEILTAGPELMYVPIPREMRRGETKVRLSYRGAPFYWFCFAVTVAASVLAILYLIFGDFFFKKIRLDEKIRTYTRKINFANLSKWWGKEEE